VVKIFREIPPSIPKQHAHSNLTKSKEDYHVVGSLVMASPGGVPSGDSSIMASFYSELRALREDIKILLDNQKETKRRGFKDSKEVGSADGAACEGDELPSTEDVLRDLRGEMTSLKDTLRADLHQITDSFRACLDALGSSSFPNADSACQGRSRSAPHPADINTFRELAEIVVQTKVFTTPSNP
jgi:hypothetical protein